MYLENFGVTKEVNTMADDRATEETQRRYDRLAAIYDLTELPMELLVFRRLRRPVWEDVRGESILEVGVGTGKNLTYHPDAARVIALDVSPAMLRRASGRARRMGSTAEFVLGDAQRLPLRSGAFDTVAATFVFCSVPDPIAGLQEAGRVVRDGGHVRLLEHVRAKNPLVGRLMDLLNPVAVRMTGANINRDTVANVRKAGVALESVESRAFGIIKWIRGARSDGSAMEELTAAAAPSNVCD